MLQAPAERMIRDCVACELAYINTDHPAFIGGNQAVAAVMEARAGGGGSSDSEEAGEPASAADARLAALTLTQPGACHNPAVHAPVDNAW